MTFKDIYDHEALKVNFEANLNRKYQQCNISVMDTIADPFITFDENGICNYYHSYLEDEKNNVLRGLKGASKLKSQFDKIKYEGRSQNYDCILGLSGGVDSTYLCLLAKEHNLKPLVVHFDNGWNSELAQHNIENTVKLCGFDLFTYVIDWMEFREMQLAYLRASVVDIEVLTDHAFMAVLYDQARKWKIKYVLAGMNIVTEQVLPKHWIYQKLDSVNIKNIVNTYGNLKIKDIKTYPFLNYNTKRYCDKILKMEIISPLNWIEYNYETVKTEIINKLNWRDYGGKHYESIWTRFYQGYILPKKFHIDKRKAHLSNLIFSGQITKEEALTKLSEPTIEISLLLNDLKFVQKKLGLDSEDFNKLMELPRVEHTYFQTQKGLFQKYPSLKWIKSILGGVQR